MPGTLERLGRPGAGSPQALGKLFIRRVSSPQQRFAAGARHRPSRAPQPPLLLLLQLNSDVVANAAWEKNCSVLWWQGKDPAEVVRTRVGPGCEAGGELPAPCPGGQWFGHCVFQVNLASG